jgi:F0F1-type ATP synthase membrane subunit b/b'
MINTLSHFFTEICVEIPDIFEANLVNILILDGAIVYLLGGALTSALSTRSTNILKEIREAEDALLKAVVTLVENEAKLKNAKVLVEAIGTNAEATACQEKDRIMVEAELKCRRLEESSRTKADLITEFMKLRIKEVVVVTLSEEIQQLFKYSGNIRHLQAKIQHEFILKLDTNQF